MACSAAKFKDPHALANVLRRAYARVSASECASEPFQFRVLPPDGWKITPVLNLVLKSPGPSALICSRFSRRAANAESSSSTFHVTNLHKFDSQRAITTCEAELLHDASAECSSGHTFALRDSGPAPLQFAEYHAGAPKMRSKSQGIKITEILAMCGEPLIVFRVNTFVRKVSAKRCQNE